MRVLGRIDRRILQQTAFPSPGAAGPIIPRYADGGMMKRSIVFALGIAALALQIEGFRKMTPAQKLQMVAAL